MNSSVPSISESEWLVASVVWAEAGLTAAEIAKRLRARTSWKQKTVNTFLARLVAKGVVSAQVDGRAYRYFEGVAREKCVRKESDSFLRRVFGGAVAPLLAHFCETADLSDEELAHLKKILRGKGRAPKSSHEK